MNDFVPDVFIRIWKAWLLDNKWMGLVEKTIETFNSYTLMWYFSTIRERFSLGKVLWFSYLLNNITFYPILILSNLYLSFFCTSDLDRRGNLVSNTIEEGRMLTKNCCFEMWKITCINWKLIQWSPWSSQKSKW